MTKYRVRVECLLDENGSPDPEKVAGYCIVDDDGAYLDSGGGLWISGSRSRAEQTALELNIEEATLNCDIRDEFMKYLNNPAAVHAMMLRGTIATPSWRAIVDLMGEVPNGEDAKLARIAELQFQLSELRTNGGAQ